MDSAERKKLAHLVYERLVERQRVRAEAATRDTKQRHRENLEKLLKQLSDRLQREAEKIVSSSVQIFERKAEEENSLGPIRIAMPERASSAAVRLAAELLREEDFCVQLDSDLRKMTLGFKDQ